MAESSVTSTAVNHDRIDPNSQNISSPTKSLVDNPQLAAFARKRRRLSSGSNVSADNGRPCSPESNCPICLNQLENKSFTDSCFHQFCFTCLVEWSKVKAECPLCKQAFKSIIHNVRSYEDYDQYHVPKEPVGRAEGLWPYGIMGDGSRFRYRSTMLNSRNSEFVFGVPASFDRILSLTRRRASRSRGRRSTRPNTRSSSPRRGSSTRSSRVDAAAEFRRSLYSRGVRVIPATETRSTAEARTTRSTRSRRGLPATARPSRFRDTTPQFYRDNVACTHRLVPWLNRELNVLLHGETSNVEFVQEYILNLIGRFEIRSPEFRELIAPYLARRTDHFVHEFFEFARSPYDMAAYDRKARYDQTAVSAAPTERLTSSDDSDSGIIDSIYDLRALPATSAVRPTASALAVNEALANPPDQYDHSAALRRVREFLGQISASASGSSEAASSSHATRSHSSTLSTDVVDISSPTRPVALSAAAATVSTQHDSDSDVQFVEVRPKPRPPTPELITVAETSAEEAEAPPKNEKNKKRKKRRHSKDRRMGKKSQKVGGTKGGCVASASDTRTIGANAVCGRKTRSATSQKCKETSKKEKLKRGKSLGRGKTRASCKDAKEQTTNSSRVENRPCTSIVQAIYSSTTTDSEDIPLARIAHKIKKRHKIKSIVVVPETSAINKKKRRKATSHDEVEQVVGLGDATSDVSVPPNESVLSVAESSRKVVTSTVTSATVAHSDVNDVINIADTDNHDISVFIVQEDKENRQKDSNTLSATKVEPSAPVYNLSSDDEFAIAIVDANEPSTSSGQGHSRKRPVCTISYSSDDDDDPVRTPVELDLSRFSCTEPVAKAAPIETSWSERRFSNEDKWFDTVLLSSDDDVIMVNESTAAPLGDNGMTSMEMAYKSLNECQDRMKANLDAYKLKLTMVVGADVCGTSTKGEVSIRDLIREEAIDDVNVALTDIVDIVVDELDGPFQLE